MRFFKSIPQIRGSALSFFVLSLYRFWNILMILSIFWISSAELFSFKTAIIVSTSSLLKEICSFFARLANANKNGSLSFGPMVSISKTSFVRNPAYPGKYAGFVHLLSKFHFSFELPPSINISNKAICSSDKSPFSISGEKPPPPPPPISVPNISVPNKSIMDFIS